MKIDGYVSKKNIRRWLDNYESLVAGDVFPDALPSNSGPKNYDGVSPGRLNKIMLDHAVGQLSPAMRRVVAYKWTRPIKTRDALTLLGCSSSVYSRLCAFAVLEIYNKVNGPAVNYKALAETVYGS